MWPQCLKITIRNCCRYSTCSGEAALLAGRLDDAEQALDKAYRLRQGGRAQDQISTLLLQTQLRHRQKRYPEALALCRDAEQAAVAQGDAGIVAFALLQRAQIAKQSGDGAQALTAYREALLRYQAAHDSPDTVNGTIAAALGMARLPVGPSSTIRSVSQRRARRLPGPPPWRGGCPTPALFPNATGNWENYCRQRETLLQLCGKRSWPCITPSRTAQVISCTSGSIRPAAF